MAHGSPILYICKDCHQYMYGGRFSPTPVCSCGKKSEQITKEKLRSNYWISPIESLVFSFNNWTKVKPR